MKVIRVRFIPCSPTKPARICADDGDGNRVIVSADDDQDDTRACKYRRAAIALCHRMGWKGKLIGGAHGNTYYYTWADPRDMFAIPKKPNNPNTNKKR